MFKRNIHILKDTEAKTEASNSSRPLEVNLGSPLPDALPGRLQLLGSAGDVDIYLLDVEAPERATASEVNETQAGGPEPAWPYKEVTDICHEVFQEVKRATQKHAPMNSPHEGHSVIREEFEELWEHVKADTGRSSKARKEAIQVAATAVRYVLDLQPGQ